MTNPTFDFTDGLGPVPAHRHINPDGSEGGWVADAAGVSRLAFIGPDATVGSDGAANRGAHILDHAHVACGQVAGGTVRGSAIISSGYVGPNTTVEEHATVRGHLTDNVTVRGMAQIGFHVVVEASAGSVIEGEVKIEGRGILNLDGCISGDGVLTLEGNVAYTKPSDDKSE